MTVAEPVIAAPLTRMRAADRRESVLAAATQVFGDFGYVGSTTAQIAKAAGVSQPYVVRMFGTKESLFIEVIDRALESLLAAFREAVADTASPLSLEKRMGEAYVNQLTDRGLLLSLMHAFVLGKDPVIGQAGRAGFIRVYRYLRDEAGFEPAQVEQFLASGMLINTMIGLGMTASYDSDPDVRELMSCVFPSKLDLVRRLEG